VKASQIVADRAKEWEVETKRRTDEYRAKREGLQPAQEAWEHRTAKERPDHNTSPVCRPVQEAAAEYCAENLRNLGITVELYKLANELKELGL